MKELVYTYGSICFMIAENVRKEVRRDTYKLKH